MFGGRPCDRNKSLLASRTALFLLARAKVLLSSARSPAPPFAHGDVGRLRSLARPFRAIHRKSPKSKTRLRNPPIALAKDRTTGGELFATAPRPSRRALLDRGPMITGHSQLARSPKLRHHTDSRAYQFTGRPAALPQPARDGTTSRRRVGRRLSGHEGPAASSLPLRQSYGGVGWPLFWTVQVLILLG
jgi:hypothetical protein